ncbi:MAG TPA: N-acetylmuramoyl-L-alanine amidase [Anaerolineae bacterium]|nr:N-acetylmuramoyl-L-alanine amidase [Anaerolineae bacterium]
MRQTPKARRPWATNLFVFAFLLGFGYVLWLSLGAPRTDTPAPPASSEAAETPLPTRTPKPTRTARPSKTPRPSATPTPEPLRVGIVAGHWQNDSGAVCADGLEEVDINLEVATEVVRILRAEGYRADLLPEFSEELAGYQAAAFVSIHVDSCESGGLSGFKAARVASSAIPDEEDRLVACLVEEYSSSTGLALHEDTITFDMTDYHAFWEIDPGTPGAIIELGFMDGDRDLLTRLSDRAAEGVARGILRFLASR